MNGWDLVLLGVALIGYAVVSGRLVGTIVSPAMLFVGAGYLLGGEVLGFFSEATVDLDVRTLAEITLALVLFADASTIDTKRLEHETTIPLRLLGIGLPLTIVLGTVVAIPFFPELGLFEAVALAVLLAPTDAALGQAVVSDRRIPSRLRQGLAVESGLNDGVCVPLLFGAIVAAELAEIPTFDGQLVVDLIEEVGIASLVGAAAALAAVFVAKQADKRGWLLDQWAQIVPLATIIVSYAAAVQLGGSGFIATFVGGLLYGKAFQSRAHETMQFTEEAGDILSAVTFVMFGAVVIGQSITSLDGPTIAYAVLSLTVVRMIPVAIAMIGSGVRPQTAAFAGWFGPRGLASIVFMLIVVEDSNLPGTQTLVQVVTFTVVLSVFAHGISAVPLSNRYVNWLGRAPDQAAGEAGDSSGSPHRGRWARRPRSSPSNP